MRNTDTAFMVPTAIYMSEADAAECVLDESDPWQLDGEPEPAEAGWYSRLSAPGYMDCTEWDGPHANAFRALRSCCETYDVDVRGNLRD